MKQPQIKAIVGLMLVSVVALTLIDYQFKAGAKAEYAPENLASFFGMFYGVASAVALVIQLFAVHWILKTGGMFAGLAILPVALFVTSLIAWTSQAFQLSVATKFAVQIFAFTIDSAALQMLYLGIARQTRSQARALAEGIGKPLATGLTGLCLIAFADSSALYKLAFAACAFSLAWTVLARINHNAYIRSLVTSLGSKKFDVSEETSDVFDSALATRIKDSLASADDEEVVYLLGVLPTLDGVDWSEEYRTLSERSDPRIKIAALCYLRDHGSHHDVQIAVSMLDNSDPSVRENAIDTVAQLGNTEQVTLIEECLQDPKPETKAAAIAALINTEDLDRLLVAGAELKEMLGSSRVDDRIAAAHALGRMKRGLLRPMTGLLRDEDPKVIRAALEASLSNQDSRLVPAITPLLANLKVATLAGDTLAVYGTKTLDHLIPFLELADTEGAFEGSQGIPPILAKIGDPIALPALEKAARSADPILSSNAVHALARILVKSGLIKERKSDIEDIVLKELAASTKSRIRERQLTDHPNAAILCSALGQKSKNHLSNAFILLDILTPGVRLQELYQSLTRSEEDRGNVIEVLENVLRGQVRTETLTTIRETDAPPCDDVEALLREILDEPCSNWVKIGALHAIGQHALSQIEMLILDLRHSHPVVRETALKTLADQKPDLAIQEARKLTDDEAPIVRHLAEEILEPVSA
jgi:HEAT repeat protein